VVLAGCHTEANPRQIKKAEALCDWSAGLIGLRVGPLTDLAGLYITEKNRHRASEELKRVLYVAMTRAREHLVLSCAPSSDRSSRSFLSLLDEPLENRISSAGQSTVVETGPGKLNIEVVEASLTAPGLAKSKKTTTEKKSSWQPYIELWNRRRQDYAAALKAPVFVTPTLLKRQEQETTEAAETTQLIAGERTPAMLVGELAHRFLEHWDFAGTQESFSDQLGPFLATWLPPEYHKEVGCIRGELEAILDRFVASDIYTELADSQVLGREVPFLVPWGGRTMEGVIDLIYERNGLLYLADYKTDKIEPKELRLGAERYRQQAEIYSRAARQSLQRNVAAFKLIFLRLGEAIEVDAHLIQGELFPIPPS
jgi:ATP-dependent helicase/nuclease subunit A